MVLELTIKCILRICKELVELKAFVGIQENKGQYNNECNYIKRPDTFELLRHKRKELFFILPVNQPETQ